MAPGIGRRGPPGTDPDPGPARLRPPHLPARCARPRGPARRAADPFPPPPPPPPRRGSRHSAHRPGAGGSAPPPAHPPPAPEPPARPSRAPAPGLRFPGPRVPPTPGLPALPTPPSHNTKVLVHALNILRALFRDTPLGENIIPYVAGGAKAAILGFTSPVWADAFIYPPTHPYCLQPLKTIGKIATCLELQSAALQSTQSQEEFKLEDLKKLEPILKNILTYNKEFPFDVQPSPLRRILAPGEEEHLEFEEDEEEGGAGAGSPNSFPARVPVIGGHNIFVCGAEDRTQAAGMPGTLLPRLPSEPGMTLLTIRIEKIGLKDAGQCIDPYITVSIKDLNGIDLTPLQDTPVASRKEDTYVHFNVDIELQKHIEKLTKGAAIFFEFKHYKLKKKVYQHQVFCFHGDG
ncbi:axin interactor, dorsalization-associated protein-like [Ictidomys tridecemlineatus]